MDEAEIEVDASMASWVMDSFFPDAQQNVQNREADALERVRNILGDQVSVEVAEEFTSFCPQGSTWSQFSRSPETWVYHETEPGWRFFSDTDRGSMEGP